MTSTSQELPAPAAEPKIEVTINTKPNAKPNAIENDHKHDPEDCTCDATIPKLARKDSYDSILSVDADYRRPVNRARPNYVRRYSPSPIRIRNPPPVIRDLMAVLSSSTHLLEKVGKYDGIADLPYPARGSIYLTTYPFTDNDVKKWSWLFSVGVEETFLEQRGRSRTADIDSEDENHGLPSVHPVRRRSPYYNDMGTNVDIPSIYLSRALDQDAVPEETKDVKYLIVIQNRHRPAGSKLLIAESRKAAGIMMYYEALRGDSVLFVGAVVGLGKKAVHPKKFRKVESLEEAVGVKEEGGVGVLC